MNLKNSCIYLGDKTGDWLLRPLKSVDECGDCLLLSFSRWLYTCPVPILLGDLRTGLFLGESDLGPKRLLGDGDLLTGGLVLGNGEPLRLGDIDLFLDLDLLIGRLAGECVLERRGERRLGVRDLDLERLGGGLRLGDLDFDLLGGGLL